MKKVNYIYVHSAAQDQIDKRKDFVHRMANIINKFSINKSNHIIAISKYVKKTIIEVFKVSNEKIEVFYNGVELYTPNNIPELINNKSNIKLICIGRLIEEKGVQNIINAMKYLDNRYTLTIVGEGSYKEELKRISKGIENKIIFLGNRSDIKELLENHDIFIHLPKWQEGFGISVVEAMSAGKLCIVGNSGALPEIIDSGKNGYIVKDYSPEYLSSYIMNLNDSINLRKEAINRAQEFEIIKYSNKLDELIEK